MSKREVKCAMQARSRGSDTLRAEGTQENRNKSGKGGLVKAEVVPRQIYTSHIPSTKKVSDGVIRALAK